MSLKRLLLALTTSVALLFNFPAGAHALSLDWSSNEEVMAPSLAASGPNGDSRIVSDALGNQTAVWLTGNQFQTEIFYSTKAAGSTWSQPAAIPQAGFGANWPELAVSSDGTVVAVWSYLSAGQYMVESATKAWGAAWSVPETISTEVNQMGSQEPSIVFDGHGKFVATWSQSTNTWVNGQNVTIIASSEYDLATQTWSNYQQLAEMAPYPNAVKLTVGFDGAISLVWFVFDPTSNFTILKYLPRDTSGTWGTVTNLTPQNRTNEAPNLGIAATMFDENNATVVWSCVASICAKVLEDGVWGATQVLGNSENSPVATTTPDGTVTVVFQEGTNWGLSNFVSLTRALHGSWSAPTSFGEPVTSVWPRMISLAASSDGLVVFVWANQDYSQFSSYLSAVYKTSSYSEWSDTTRLQTSNVPWFSVFPYITPGANGSILTIWDNNENGSATYSTQLNMSYSLHYSLNNGTGTLPTEQAFLRGSNGLTVAPGTGITFGSREFLNWNTAADGSGTTITPGQALSLTADTTLYAQFTPVVAAPSPTQTPTPTPTESAQSDELREVSLASTGLNFGVLQIVGAISGVFIVTGVLFIILRSRRNRQRL